MMRNDISTDEKLRGFSGHSLNRAHDEQAFESITRALGVALFTEKEVIVTVWSEEEDQSIRGKITKFDRTSRRFRVENAEEYSWISFHDVRSIDLII